MRQWGQKSPHGRCQTSELPHGAPWGTTGTPRGQIKTWWNQRIYPYYIDDKNNLKVTTGPPSCPLKHPWGTPGATHGQNKTWMNHKIKPWVLQRTRVDHEFISVITKAYVTICISKIFWFDQVLFWPRVTPRVPHGCFRGQFGGPVVTLRWFLSSMKHMQQPMLLSSLIPTSFDLTSRCPRDTQGVPHGATQLSGSDHEVIFVLIDPHSTNFTSNIFGLNFEILEGEIVSLIQVFDNLSGILITTMAFYGFKRCDF